MLKYNPKSFMCGVQINDDICTEKKTSLNGKYNGSVVDDGSCIDNTPVFCFSY